MKEENKGRYISSQMARYYYINDKTRLCYKELCNSEWTIKNLGMFLTAWSPALRNYVKNKYNILDTK